MLPEKNLIYFYELPKDNTTSTKLADKIKSLTDYNISEHPQIRRDPNKTFYSAIIKINDPKFKEIASKIKYFDIEGKQCRALPFDRELLGVNRAQANKSNVFVKGLDKANITTSK